MLFVRGLLLQGHEKEIGLLIWFVALDFGMNISIDPLGLPTVTTGNDHYYHTYMSCVRPFVNQLTKKPRKTKQILSDNNYLCWQDYGSGQGDH